MEMEGVPFLVNMMTWPTKHDFRLRSETLRSAGSIGDILMIAKPARKEDPYRVEIVKRGSLKYAKYLRLCSQGTPNSRKRWGYL
jgi:hypothetical protein